MEMQILDPHQHAYLRSISQHLENQDTPTDWTKFFAEAALCSDDIKDFTEFGLIAVTWEEGPQMQFVLPRIHELIANDFRIELPSEHAETRFDESEDAAQRDIRGAVHAIGESLIGNSVLTEDFRGELLGLLNELGEALDKLPDAQRDDQEAILLGIQDVVTEINRHRPNPRRLDISLDGLIKATRNLGSGGNSLFPTVLQINALIAPFLSTPGDAPPSSGYATYAMTPEPQLPTLQPPEHARSILDRLLSPRR